MTSHPRRRHPDDVTRSPRHTYLGRVVHHRADVVRHAERVGAVLVELADVVFEVVPHDADAVVAVYSLLLMPQAEAVADLVHDGAELRRDNKIQNNNAIKKHYK